MLSEENEEFRPEISLDEFKSWIRSDKTLPQNMDDLLLQRFLRVYDSCDLKKSQDLLRLNLSIRVSGPQLFANRDVLSNEIQRATKIIQFCPLPKLTDQNCKVTIIRLANYDVNQFYYVEILKMALMIFDARFTMYDDYDATIASGEYFIIDGEGLSFRHFLQVVKNISTVRLYMRYLQEAAPFVIKNLHFVNGSSIVNRFFSLIRPILKKELLEVIHFHTHGFDSLHEFVPKDVLPEEYGGRMGPIKDIHSDVLKRFESKRDYLLDDSKWKISK